MKITDIVALARDKCKTNSTTFPDSTMLLYIKAKLPIYQSDIEGSNENYMGSIEHRDLIATGTGIVEVDGEDVLTREYNLPSDMIPRLGKVYAKLNGTKWTLLKHYDLQEAGVLEEDRILEKFSNVEGVAGYTIFRGSLILLTGEIEAGVTNGLRIWTYSFSSLITSIPAVGSDDDVEFDVYGIPETLHELFATALSLEWKSNQERPIPLTSMEQNYYALYRERIDALKGLDRSKSIQFSRPADGYDNGFNL